MAQAVHRSARYPRTPATYAVPIAAALAWILCIPPLVVHLRARNLAASVLVSSMIAVNLFTTINSILWPTDNLEQSWKGWGLCDLEVKLYIGCPAALAGALGCIFRQLAVILDTDNATPIPTSSQRRRRRMIELLLCLIIPSYLMAVHYVVQPVRFYLFAISGCVPGFDNSWPSYVLVLMWPLMLCLITSYYCALAAYRLVKYRRQFSSILSASHFGMTRSRFIRLFTLDAVLILGYLPLSIFTFWQNLNYSHHGYSWDNIHPPHWSTEIITVPTNGHLNFDRWIQIGTGYLVFCFFGFGHDAKQIYHNWLQHLGLLSLWRRLGIPSRIRWTSEKLSSAEQHILGSFGSGMGGVTSTESSKSPDDIDGEEVARPNSGSEWEQQSEV